MLTFVTLVTVALAAQLNPTLCDPWAIACQAPLSMELSGQEYWSGLPFPSPGDLPNPGIESGSRIPGRFSTIQATRNPFDTLVKQLLRSRWRGT